VTYFKISTQRGTISLFSSPFTPLSSLFHFCPPCTLWIQLSGLAESYKIAQWVWTEPSR